MFFPRLAVWLMMAGWLVGATVVAETPDWDQAKHGKVADLPAGVSPVAGQLSLLADYANEKDGIIWLYLVNATDATISIPSQDGDVYSKRESPDAKGNWIRCDRHSYSWCGNSYVPIAIQSGDYYRWRQSLNSAKGEIKPVRFRLYNEQEPALVSNEGKARIDSSEIEQCRYDAMCLRYGPLEDVAAIALCKVPFNGGVLGDPLRLAIESLQRFRDDPRFFDTLTEILESLRQSNATASKDRRPLLEESYWKALQMLQSPSASQANEKRNRVRDFLIAQFNDPKNPWRPYAFVELSSAYKDDRSVQSLITRVLDSPRERVFYLALRAYADFAPKTELLARLSSMEKNPKYSRENRAAVKKLKEEMQTSDTQKGR